MIISVIQIIIFFYLYSKTTKWVSKRYEHPEPVPKVPCLVSVMDIQVPSDQYLYRILEKTLFERGLGTDYLSYVYILPDTLTGTFGRDVCPGRRMKAYK